VPSSHSTYEIRVKGRLGVTTLSAFPTLVPEFSEAETILTGPLEDRAAVFGTIIQMEALGLDLIAFRRIASQPK
jgi:hypothetical protein